MSLEDDYIKGRGAQINPPNPYHITSYSSTGQIWHDEDEMDGLRRTEYILTHPKTIINKVDSPDVGFEYSMNPYQGCEHGCVYCYARNTHNYWGYSSGIEFEQKILVKKEAPAELEKKLKSKNWKAAPIMLSGNTDCYQPAEKKYKLTRQILEICLKYNHPVSLITKNALIVRDLDILSEMAKKRLVKVAFSITTLSEEVRLKLEPRTASGLKRLQTMKRLSDAGVPTIAMMAPVIPSINDHEIYTIAEKAAEAGARAMSYTVVRLNGSIADIFKDWIQKNYPDRAKRVLEQIKQCHGGYLNDSKFKRRMRGDGPIAAMIKQQVELARQRFFSDREVPEFDLELYENSKTIQLSLF